nr:immunoglobulin light chain junction region [Macaca mulatta]MOV62568.1 immunoglobulin light chain junction region [Macaca mulatta]MOV63662.1 immunoglobulin light chain junction region [Macaca mulatta]MOV64836.1 immunoglobulin light chain junction region [Macaca mulatta]
CQHESNWSLTF